MSFIKKSGVRQGGVTSAQVFNVYIHELFLRLRDRAFGCFIFMAISVATGGQLGAIAPLPPPTVIRSTPKIRANPRSLGGGGGEGDNRKAESNESNKNHRQLQL